MRRAVRSLFFSRYEPSKQDAEARRPPGPRQKHTASRMHGVIRHLRAEQALTDRVQLAIAHILETVASTLGILCLSDFAWHRDLAVPDALPVLREITHLGQWHLTEKSANPLFTHIRSLHLVGIVGFEYVTHLASFASCLTHFPLSYTETGSIDVDGWLEALNHPGYDEPLPALLRDLVFDTPVDKPWFREDGKRIVK